MTVEVVVENGGAEVSPVAKIVTLDVKRQGSAEINVTPNPSMEDEGDRIDLVRDSEGRWVVRWWKARISRPFMLIVRRGTEPRQLAFSAALGVTLGVFPIYGQFFLHDLFDLAQKGRKKFVLADFTWLFVFVGVTLFLCAIAVCVLRSRCHAPTLMLTNFVATPLELALLIPFLRLGEWLTNGGHIMLSSNALWKAVTGKATKSILLSLLHAVNTKMDHIFKRRCVMSHSLGS
ncbi:uncharacterized protein LOC9659113 isoform X1 [Selaginella moellendorffii]|uniref:uncharacterized protein LOC9659113 isoform X1 n=1 Tax=Selaginella moellendorffii TaxID=88036 RepID=UPI000D1CFC30|nr:uncharacterized protein LOC9659113 isoform X1 [Selaginella moellendorffii]|eukprot:XP_024520398.1 uncharacterized protein LOC9659113 isoform X1 [Selaginella moellendorffii]